MSDEDFDSAFDDPLDEVEPDEDVDVDQAWEEDDPGEGEAPSG